MEKFNSILFIKKLLDFSPREGINETKAGVFLTSLLRKNNVKYYLQKFNVYIPKKIKTKLVINENEEIPVEPICFFSGVIESVDNIISSFLPGEKNFSYISFNPYCNSISIMNRSIKYPAIAIRRKDLFKVIKAKKTRVTIKIKKEIHQSQNILVGNIYNPKNLIFAHYDSISIGAVDNASGVCIAMRLILENPNIINKSLFIFSGNEELSYDFPIYWGKGYREFEKKYFDLMKQAKKIYVVDCVGNGEPQKLSTHYWIDEAFPIKNKKIAHKKTLIITGDIKKLWTYYHSDLDTINKLKKKYLDATYKLMLKVL